MFGYVVPCKMELKIKDYEKFKAYYCGLCVSIKRNFGNLPRLSLNYDMTFLAILLDSLEDSKPQIATHRCILHPTKKRIILENNAALDYAGLCNVLLMYYKLIDNVEDDSSKISSFLVFVLKIYIKAMTESKAKLLENYIKTSLSKLSSLEKNPSIDSIDEISHVFADLTGYILSLYAKNENPEEQNEICEPLYWLGYNLGKWIYVIDAWDDLEKDMKNNKFNLLNKLYNKDKKDFKLFSSEIEEKVDFLLISTASNCLENLDKIHLYKNKELLNNILQFGLMEKMDTVFKRSELKNAKSI